MKIDVGTRIDDEWHTEFRGGLPRGGEALTGFFERSGLVPGPNAVLAIHAARAYPDDFLDAIDEIGRGAAEPTFDVCGYRHFDGIDYALDRGEHLVPRNLLAVRITKRPRDARAGGGDGLEAHLFHERSTE